MNQKQAMADKLAVGQMKSKSAWIITVFPSFNCSKKEDSPN